MVLDAGPIELLIRVMLFFLFSTIAYNEQDKWESLRISVPCSVKINDPGKEMIFRILS